ncbi:CPXCG motif-containing cysteine-rich protein [Endozoicomonas ascidiicola]|uniref:CPXCG motif-containing cysteine-rich protein n=1 Tax=Endozoicomonas ascidiicola TaxID=1698521 RepID=UPI00082CDFD3|nr:CPXCG motif-containing cysteine-rich protein [Endozoicomonas ascidiicola]
MGTLEETAIYCPYCGEPISVLINEEDVGQEYIEDCQVCCKPITFIVSTDINGDLSVSVREENETF